VSDLEFRAPDRFTTGTVGAPGQRVFYLQVAEDDRVATFKLEKQQVSALADSLAELLTDLAEPSGPPPDASLHEPVIAEWTVGAMGLGYDEDDDRIMVVVQAAGGDETDDELDALDDLDDLDSLGRPSGPATARILLTRSLAAAFVDHAREVVEAGRPPCPFCGRPIDHDGRACPRMN
jgi:uncharacterized repeat protein (TIGR03847 family)